MGAPVTAQQANEDAILSAYVETKKPGVERVEIETKSLRIVGKKAGAVILLELFPIN